MNQKYKISNIYTPIIIVIFFISFFIYRSFISNNSDNNYRNTTRKEPVRIIYFHGGRVNMIYRTYINKYFDLEGIDVKLYTKDLRGTEIIEVPKSHTEFKELAKDKLNFGKISGIEIADKVIKGEFDGGTIGASSFIYSINRGLPIIAVAMLGYDAVAGKGILLRSDIKIISAEDFKNRTLISRRAGPGDAIYLREFIKSLGLDPERDLTIIDQIDENDAEKWLKQGKIDGGLYHLASIRNKRYVESGIAYVYQPMNWMNSKVSHALLVFHKDYLEVNREKVQKLVNAYVKRIAYEKGLPEEEKDKSWDKGLMMKGEFQGMRIPTYDLPPKLRIELLNETQDLLLKYRKVDKRVDIKKNLDYSFVEKAMEEIKS